MALEKPPCKGCPDRHANCYSECKKYAEYKERIKAAREAAAKHDRESWDVAASKTQVYKIGKRLRKKKP